MNKIELISKIAKEAEVTQKVAATVFDATFEVIKEQMVAGDEITVKGFGSFGTKVRAAHEGRNPLSGEVIQVAETVLPTFRSSKVLKAAVKK